jgi:hypothetical protein
MQEENKINSQQQQKQTKSIMENIQHNQEIMMGYLANDFKTCNYKTTNNGKAHKNMNSSPSTDNNQSYMNESDDKSKTDFDNNTFHREPTSRTATPFNDIMSCMETESPAAKKH